MLPDDDDLTLADLNDPSVWRLARLGALAKRLGWRGWPDVAWAPGWPDLAGC